MTYNWVTKALGKKGSAAEIDEASLDEKVVILMQGTNVFGDPIYSYLQLTLRALKELKSAMDSGKDFSPSDYGAVIAAGKGEPTPQLRAEMAVAHQMVDISKKAAPAPNIQQPKVWGEGEGGNA